MKEPDIDSVKEKLTTGVRDIREYEKVLENWTDEQFEENRKKTVECTQKVVDIINAKKDR